MGVFGLEALIFSIGTGLGGAFTFAFVFFDTGYYLRNANPSYNIDQISDFKIGYGFGINLETGLGVLGVSFALGKGDSFSEGKIHFGIINEF